MGVQGAAVVGLAGVKTQGAAVLGGNRAAVGQCSVGAEGDAAGTGVNLAGVADAAAGIGGNQGDFAGIHAAQGAGVDGKDGSAARRRRVAGCRRGFDTAGGVGLAAGGNHLDVLSPNAAVNLGGSAENAGVVGIAPVKTLCADFDTAAADVQTVETAVCQDGTAGGEGGACAVDKAAAVDADAGGVGHHHFGAAAGDFDIALKLTRVAAVDLVDDDAGFAAGEKGVALYPAGLAGGYAFMAVVENGAARVDIETAVLVDGYAVGGGGLDIDLRQSVAGLQDDGLLGFGGGFVGLDVGSGGGHNQGRTETEQQAESQRAQMQTAA